MSLKKQDIAFSLVWVGKSAHLFISEKRNFGKKVHHEFAEELSAVTFRSDKGLYTSKKKKPTNI